MQKRILEQTFSLPDWWKAPWIDLDCQVQGDLLIQSTFRRSPSPSCSLRLHGEDHGKIFSLLTEWMGSYLQGEDPPLDGLPFAWTLFPRFTRNVLQILMTIPFGETLSYQEVAGAIGQPTAARAVGNACGRNLFPLFIPCHRVLASNGSYGGFTGGIEIKKDLLAFEKRSLQKFIPDSVTGID